MSGGPKFGVENNARGEFIAQGPAQQYNAPGGTINMGMSSHNGHDVRSFAVREQAQVHIGDISNYISVDRPSQIDRFRNKYYEIPRNPSSFFTGRQEICEQMRASCLVSNQYSPQQKRFVIHGLGGSGKTQLCLKFAEDHREEFWGIFWIDATSSAKIEQDFLRIANICGLNSDADVLRRWLSNIQETWMLIFDNADDPSLDISSYFPVGGQGAILITTRNPRCAIHATVGSCELGKLATEEATTLILKAANVLEPCDKQTLLSARQVVDALGYLALAIDHAGAVIRKGLCTMEEYCEIFSKRRRDLLSDDKSGQRIGGYQYTVYTTWEISIRMIRETKDQASGDATELLKIFGYFHHESIPEEVFRRAWENIQGNGNSEWMRSHQPSLVQQQSTAWNSLRLRNAIVTLSSYSLVTRNKDSLISVHPLVNMWTRDRLCELDRGRNWVLTICALSMSISPSFETADYRFRKLLIPHMDTCLGFYSEWMSRISESEKLNEIDYTHQVANVNDKVGTIGRDCLNMASKFGLVYSEGGRRQEALRLRETVAAARKKMLGEEHPDTLSSMSNLASSYSDAGRRPEALRLRETVAAAFHKTLGEEHRDTLLSMHALANSYRDAGRRPEALRLRETVATARKMALGEEMVSSQVGQRKWWRRLARGL